MDKLEISLNQLQQEMVVALVGMGVDKPLATALALRATGEIGRIRIATAQAAALQAEELRSNPRPPTNQN